MRAAFSRGAVATALILSLFSSGIAHAGERVTAVSPTGEVSSGSLDGSPVSEPVTGSDPLVNDPDLLVDAPDLLVDDRDLLVDDRDLLVDDRDLLVDADDPLLDEDWDDELIGPEIYDPLEKGNRVVFSFNKGLDRWLLSPLRTGYRFILPAPARRAIRRVATNLNTPAYLVNHLLQGEFVDAAETLGAFVVNTTVGWGGLFEPSLEMGWEHKSADFGETLALYGVGAGAFLIIPALGPTTVRDGVGRVIDTAMQPLTYVMGFGFQILLSGGTGFTEFDEKSDKLKALEASSVDLYAALRSAYVQSRESSIAKRRSENANPIGTPDAALATGADF
jgi:phospholipid-binding lipoprotein MlaA